MNQYFSALKYWVLISFIVESLMVRVSFIAIKSFVYMRTRCKVCFSTNSTPDKDINSVCVNISLPLKERFNAGFSLGFYLFWLQSDLVFNPTHSSDSKLSSNTAQTVIQYQLHCNTRTRKAERSFSISLMCSLIKFHKCLLFDTRR